MVSALPQLLALSTTNSCAHLTSDSATPSPADVFDYTDTSQHNKFGVAPWAATRVTLGLGKKYPSALPKPDNVSFTWWAKKDWQKNPPTKSGTRRRGQRAGEDENVMQLFAEDICEGQPHAVSVSGQVAARMREVALSIAQSLLWSGQAPVTWSSATYEVKAYAYNVLAEEFKFLRYAAGGVWKMELLMSQVYSGFAGRKNRSDAGSANVSGQSKPEDTEHIEASHSDATVPFKRPPSPDDMYCTTPVHAKRSRNTEALIDPTGKHVYSELLPKFTTIEYTLFYCNCHSACTPL